jgi:hypothetical protein
MQETTPPRKNRVLYVAFTIELYEKIIVSPKYPQGMAAHILAQFSVFQS